MVGCAVSIDHMSQRLDVHIVQPAADDLGGLLHDQDGETAIRVEALAQLGAVERDDPARALALAVDV